jgi:hypothetical protein
VPDSRYWVPGAGPGARACPSDFDDSARASPSRDGVDGVDVIDGTDDFTMATI